MALEQQRLTSAERGDLVAYLDGELREPEALALRSKLDRSVTARREADALEKTWELLDHLPRPKASDDLAERTLTQIRAFDGRGDRALTTVRRGLGRAARAALWIATGTIAVASGYAIARLTWADPAARLARDLPLAEHLHEYRDVGSFELLEHLEQAPEFDRP